MRPTKLGNHHFALVRDRINAKADQLKTILRKDIHEDVDPKVVIREVFSSEHAYIVDGYLVVYELLTMRWSDTLILAEQIIFALNSEGSFTSVVEFLEAKAREAGAKYLCVGTALAKSDTALASLYQRNGFSRMAIELYKEIT